MGTAMTSLFVLLRLLAGGASDLLDYTTVEAFWKEKGVGISVDAMVAALKDVQAGPPGTKAAAVRKLMAIRTLGELKKQEAIEHLKPLLESKEMFVADYAARAIAQIQGKAHAFPGPSDAQRQSDVWLLPKESGAVAQLRLNPVAAASGPPLEGLPADIGLKIQSQLSAAVLAIAEQVGNVRFEGITVGVSKDLGQQSGFVMVVVRAEYDSRGLVAALKGKVPAKTVVGVDVFSEAGFHMLFPSDQRIVLIGGPAATKPMEAIAIGVVFEKGSIREDARMVSLIEKADTSGALWGVAQVKGAYDDLPVFRAFETVSMVGRIRNGRLDLAMNGTGTDAVKVQEAVAQVNSGVASVLREIHKMHAERPLFGPLLQAIESVKCTADGTQASLSGSSDLSGLTKMAPVIFGARGSMRRGLQGAGG